MTRARVGETPMKNVIGVVVGDELLARITEARGDTRASAWVRGVIERHLALAGRGPLTDWEHRAIVAERRLEDIAALARGEVIVRKDGKS